MNRRPSSKQILRQRRLLLKRPQMPMRGWVFLAVVGLAVVYWIVSQPSRILFGAAIVAALWLWIRIWEMLQTQKFDRMVRERSGDSICQFARHFRGSKFDPVVVRAVYETTQERCGRVDLPIRPADRFSEDYGIVEEDLDDLAADVAVLAHRSLEAAEENPLYGDVHTVAELVRFMQFQPRLSVQAAA